MIAPAIFTQTDGKQICIDAYDACLILEDDENTQVTYAITGESYAFVTDSSFEEVVKVFQIAREQARPREEGEEWRNPYDDDEK